MNKDVKKNKQITNDDPTATYRGYRRQVLYCLFRLFDDSLPSDSILHPEGEEDLAIRNSSGDLIEVIQVKDYSKDLTISDFKSAFFQRILKFCAPESKVKVAIAHFGQLGPELSTALDNDQKHPKRTISTLRGKGLNSAEVKDILKHLTTTQVNEKELHDYILGKLKSTVASGNPQQAFENLMWWLMNASENQLRLSRNVAIEKINQIGKFLYQRLSHEEEWNTSIIPVRIGQENCSELQKQEFYLGGRVQPIHIANNLDIRRDSLLRHIDEQFTDNNIVIVRAASGQGKTTLAYRYINDYSPNDFRFEVLRPTDIQHARKIALAISGHAEAIDVPTLLYLDVRPGDKAWLEFMREIAHTPNLKILITIREEDWFKSQVSASDFTFSEVSLSFDKTTGESLFSELNHAATTNRYLNFEDAWAQFGECKTLFEFVFFITQEQQLTRKIKEQVNALQDDIRFGRFPQNELKLLKLVAVASAYEARVQLKPLVKHCDISAPLRTLDRFSNEFLLRRSDDDRFVEGFHAIRSEIICSQLLDDELDPWYEYAGEVIPLLDESDLELFLLCSFSRHPEFAEQIILALTKLAPKTWVGIKGVCVALQWLGLNTYINDNLLTFKEARKLAGNSWLVMLHLDISKVNDDTSTDLFSGKVSLPSELNLTSEASQTLIKLQKDKASIFSKFEFWVKDLTHLPIPPNSTFEMGALSEVMMWVGHLKVNTPNVEWASGALLDRALLTLSIYMFAEFAIATRKVSESLYKSWYSLNEEKLRTKIQEECGIISILEDDGCLVGHYLIGLDRKTSQLKYQKEATDSDYCNIINGLSVERVEILHRCIPGYQSYGAKGYGHLVSLFKIPFDPSEMKIPVKNLMMPWLPNFNALAYGAVELSFRPDTWSMYFDSANLMRKDIIDELAQLVVATRLAEINSNKFIRGLNKWNQRQKTSTDEYILPLVAVDEWGYISESRAKDGGETLSTRFAALEQLESYTAAFTKYRHSVGNFIRKFQDAIVLSHALRTASSESGREIWNT